jgi:hypothetical protein
MIDERDEEDGEVAAALVPARRDISEHGYHLTYVLGDTTDVPFCYSVGLWQTWEHPELLLYGLNWDDTVTVMTSLAAEIRIGGSFTDGQIDEETFNRKIAFVDVPADRYEGQIPITIMYYQGFDFPMLQVVTPDEQGRFPWDAKCDPTVMARQPLLGTPPT